MTTLALYISSNIQRQLGYLAKQFVEDSSFWINHIHPDDRERVFTDLGKIFEHGNHAHEYRFLDVQGNYRWMRDELNLVCDDLGNPRKMVGYWIDITDRIEAEQTLTRAHAELNQRIQDRTRNLEEKILELKQT